MARILDLATRCYHPLRAHHTFGRSAEKVDTAIYHPAVSRIHAVLEWSGEGWNVRDLSSNGTWLSNSRLFGKDNTALNLGDELRFGGPDGPGWRLEDDSAPRSCLLGQTPNTPSYDLEPVVFLPDESNPEIVLTYSQQKRCWLKHHLSGPDEQHPELILQHAEILTCADQRWQSFLSDSGTSTELLPSNENELDEFEFVFDMSLDEENTALQLKRQSQTFSLGERSHHYLLLHLARLRAEAAEHGLDQKSQGWVDNEQLTRDLGMDMSHINILIFRARKQLSESAEPSLQCEHLVERSKGRIRFGCPRFKIYKGQQLTYQMP